MKQYKFTVVVRTPMDVKNIVWAFTHKLKELDDRQKAYEDNIINKANEALEEDE